jgi:hypothetical protein
MEGKTPLSRGRLRSSHSGKHIEDLLLYKKIPDRSSRPIGLTFFRASKPKSTLSMSNKQVLGRS